MLDFKINVNINRYYEFNLPMKFIVNKPLKSKAMFYHGFIIQVFTTNSFLFNYANSLILLTFAAD